MRRVLTGLLLLGMCGLAAAQTLRRPVADGPYRPERNRILFPGDSSAFEAFYARLDSVLFLGEGKLRILLMGGSHVQAGTLTGTLRRDLLALRPHLDGGRGLVFPFSAARTNTPSSFISLREGTWTASRNTQAAPSVVLGLTGMAVSTSDPKAAVTVVLTPRDPLPEDPAFSFDEIRVLGRTEGGDRHPAIVLQPGDTLRGVPVGDGSGWRLRLATPTDSVRICVAGSSGSFTLTGLYLDNAAPGISVTEVGVNGAALSSYARCADLERDLALVRPDLVVLAIGVNDASGTSFQPAEFAARYDALIARIRSVVPGCALLLVTNNDTCRHIRRKGYVTNANGPLAEQAFLEVAARQDAGVWDLFDLMGGLGSIRQWEEAGLAKRDKIHFTEPGYILLGDLLFNALMDRYEAHLKEGGK